MKGVKLMKITSFSYSFYWYAAAWEISISVYLFPPISQAAKNQQGDQVWEMISILAYMKIFSSQGDKIITTTESLIQIRLILFFDKAIHDNLNN
jgi:hypothetical protein